MPLHLFPSLSDCLFLFECPHKETKSRSSKTQSAARAIADATITSTLPDSAASLPSIVADPTFLAEALIPLYTVPDFLQFLCLPTYKYSNESGDELMEKIVVHVPCSYRLVVAVGRLVDHPGLRQQKKRFYQVREHSSIARTHVTNQI